MFPPVGDGTNPVLVPVMNPVLGIIPPVPEGRMPVPEG